jgi:hypothetical protein
MMTEPTSQPNLDVPPVPASVVTPRVVPLRTAAVDPAKIVQVQHLAKASGRIVGVRCAAGGRVTRILTPAGTRMRKATDQESWSDILRTQPLVATLDDSVIVVVQNEMDEPRMFDLEIELEEDATLDPPKKQARTVSRSAPTQPPNGGVRLPSPSSAARKTNSGSGILPPPKASKAYTMGTKPAALTVAPTTAQPRSDDAPVHMFLDRPLCLRIEDRLVRGSRLENHEFSQIIVAIDQGRMRKEPPKTTKPAAIVTMPYRLVVRLDAAVRMNAKLTTEELVDIVRCLGNPAVRNAKPAAGVAKAAAVEPPPPPADEVETEPLLSKEDA